MERYFWHLNGAQSDGLACVVCGADFLRQRIKTVRVGRNPDDESPVYACAEPCAEGIAREALRMARELREAAGGDDIVTADRAVLGADGRLSLLLRNLRALVGTEALIATTDDLVTLKFLLELTVHHASEVTEAAQVLRGRIDGSTD
jgi:hypothetical protein